MIQCVESLGLVDFATNLRESGVHGGIIALDSDFDHDTLALALQIPMSSIEVRDYCSNLMFTKVSGYTIIYSKTYNTCAFIVQIYFFCMINRCA